MALFGIVMYGVIMFTYALPWTTVAEEVFAPGQFVIPFAKYGLTTAGILKQTERTPPSFEDLFVYEPSLRYLAAPASEGGPHNQKTFELIGYAMILSAVVLLIPVRIVRIIGYLITMCSSAGFLLALLFFEGKAITDVGVGLWGNIAAPFVFMIATFILGAISARKEKKE